MLVAQDTKPLLVMKLSQTLTTRVPVQTDINGDIISYPAPSKLRQLNLYGVPENLIDDWYLDQGTVPCNAVFLDYSREEWAAMSSPPSLAEMKNKIIPHSGLIECYDCSKIFAGNKMNKDSLRTWIKKGIIKVKCSG